MGRFGDATAVERLAEGRYGIDLDEGYAIGEALNGGYLMAVLGRAAVLESPHAHPVSTAAAFLRVAKAGPAEIVIDTIKTGRTAATARVSLVQDGRRAVESLITTGTLDADVEPDWSGEPPVPALPPLEECPDLRRGGEDRKGDFSDRVDMRFDPSTMGWLDGQPSGSPEIRAWFQLTAAEDPVHEPELDAYVLAVAVDALPPVALNLGARGWAPTVEMTWHMRAVPAPGPLALYGGGRLLTGGWFDEEVEVWDSAGRLVAQSRQLARAGRQA
jgi:hypothetical protein